MAAGAPLRLWLLLALQLRCVTPLWVPQGNPPAEVPETPDALPGPRDWARGPPEAPGKRAPQFMVDLFNTVSVSEGTPRTQKDILNGNIVRSFEDKGHALRRFHVFNLSSFDKEERMIKAEFRWFRKKRKFYPGKLRLFHLYKVDVYEVVDSQVKPQAANLVSSRLVPLHTQGWEVFNVTQMVSKWIASGRSHGVLVVTSHVWTESPRRDGQRTDQNAYLVIFSDDGRSGASRQSFLGHGQPAAATPPRPGDNRSRRRRSPLSFLSNSSSSKPCQRVPLYVDFNEIGWSGWIISPRGYHANHCRGSCPFPLGGGLKATNHATVLSIMHALRLSSDVVEPPCCVPGRLDSISLLYFDDDENVVLKQYDDMVAVSCGCQ